MRKEKIITIEKGQKQKPTTITPETAVKIDQTEGPAGECKHLQKSYQTHQNPSIVKNSPKPIYSKKVL